MFMWEMIGQEELRTEQIKFVKTNIEEIDKNVLWALDKYGKFTQPVKPIEKIKTEEKDYFKQNKNVSVLRIDPYKVSGEMGDYYCTKFTLDNSVKKPMQGEKVYSIFEMNFDDFAKEKEKDVIVGTDKTTHLLANRAIAFTMMYCALIKNYAVMDGSPRKVIKALEQKKEEIKTKYSSNTVLIPSEILDNGVSKDAFKDLKFKYEFESSDKITERIKSGNGKGFSQMMLIKGNTWEDYLFIIDLETGDLAAYGWAGGGTFNHSSSYADDKRVKKLIAKIGESNY
jgi:hypothetical protein